MKKQLAADFFHNKDGYNCAQAVLKAYQKESGMSETTIQSATTAGGGRAEGGVCGALYAAQILLGEGQKCNKVTDSFKQAVGSILCSDIKRSECGCRRYVGIAAELTQPYIDSINSQDSNYTKARESREKSMLAPSKKFKLW